MIQNLFRSCLVCSITLITSGIAVEILKSSEFEDKEIPSLLNWKGYRHENNHNIDGNWWRWVQEEQEKTITEETVRNSADKKGYTLVFKRSIQPFRPNIDPLRSLFNSGGRHAHPNRKRWISRSFGFGNKKKSRKDSNQPLAEVQKSAHLTPSPKVAQRVRDGSNRDRMNAVPQDSHIHLEGSVVNSTYRMRGSVGNLNQSLEHADRLKYLYSPLEHPISTKSYMFEERPIDYKMSGRFQNNRLHQNSRKQESNSLPTRQRGYATGVRMYGDLHTTRRLSVEPRIWAQYTTETIFERVFEPFTELRLNPLKMKFPYEVNSRTSEQHTARQPVDVAIEESTENAQYTVPIRHQEYSKSGRIPENDFSFDINNIERANNFSEHKQNVLVAESHRNFDVFDQISIPSVSSSDTLVQLHQIEKVTKNKDGMLNMNKISHEDGNVVNNVVPSLKAGNNFKTKQIVVSDEGANYDDLPEEEDLHENNPSTLLPTKLQPKANKNQTRNLTAPARNPVNDPGKKFNGFGAAGDGCGKCGGGVNISILMPSPPAQFLTVDNGVAQISHTTSSTDKNKKKKERKKKPNKNFEDSLIKPAVAEKKDESDGTSAISAYRRNNDSLFSKIFPPSFEQQWTPNKFGSPYDSNQSSKTHYRELTAAAGKIFEAANRNMAIDLPNNNFSSWNFWSFVHQMQHSVPPTVFGAQTIGGPSEEQDDEDELKELYDEQDNLKTEDNLRSTTSLCLSHSKSTLPDYARNFLLGKNSQNGAAGRFGVLEKLKNNNSGSKFSGKGKEIQYPSLKKKNKDSSPKAHENFDSLYDPWEKYSFPRGRSSDNGYDHKRDKLYSVGKSKTNHHEVSWSQNNKPQRSHLHLQPIEGTQGSEYYDQWEALDADLKNDLTRGDQENLKVQVRNRKREVDCEDCVDDAQGYYKLSSGISLRNPSNMIISALRKGKVERKPVIYDEMLGEGDADTAKLTSVANTPH